MSSLAEDAPLISGELVGIPFRIAMPEESPEPDCVDLYPFG